MARIFISYRRVDSKWAVGRLYDRLVKVLKKENLFLDVSDIEPGEDYVERIRRIVESCDVLLAVIGRDWLTARDSSGRRRLDNTNDWVRVEIATALERGIRVIPILVDDAVMPESHELPDQLSSLSRRNAKLISFAHFHADLDSLLRILEKVLESSKPLQASSYSVTDEPDASGARDTTSSASELPLTISLETRGEVATPLIWRGDQLPAKNSQVFSTAEDNQEAVTVRLYWGEGEKVNENLLLGEFKLEEIPPEPRGAPQIEITAEVNQELTMTVTAKHLGANRTHVLDAVDLSRIEIPEAILKQAKTKPRKKESPMDFGDIFGSFSDIFEDFLSHPKKKSKKS